MGEIKVNSGNSARWFAENPSKAWGEKFFLVYSPIWMAIMGITMAAGWVKSWNDIGYMGQALVVFVNDTASVPTELSGTLSALDTDNDTFILTGTTQGDVCVRVTDRAHIFLTGVDDETQISSVVDLTELSDGMTADVYGRLELTGCLAASDIVAAAAPDTTDEDTTDEDSADDDTADE